jgi:hypothetical protein
MCSNDLHIEDKGGNKTTPRGGTKAYNNGEHYIAQVAKPKEGGGQVLLTSRGDGEVGGAHQRTSPYARVYAPTTCTRECIGARPHKGESKNSR